MWHINYVSSFLYNHQLLLQLKVDHFFWIASGSFFDPEDSNSTGIGRTYKHMWGYVESYKGMDIAKREARRFKSQSPIMDKRQALGTDFSLCVLQASGACLCVDANKTARICMETAESIGILFLAPALCMLPQCADEEQEPGRKSWPIAGCCLQFLTPNKCRQIWF